MTKKPKKPLPPEITDIVETAPDFGPGVLEVFIYTIGTGPEPIFGHCFQNNMTISEKAVMVNWIDGGYTFVPMDAVDRIHWELTQRYIQ